MEGIKREILNFISANLFMGTRVTEITEDQSFLELGILDSTGVIELIAFLEEAYGLHVEDDEIVPENLDSLVNIERYVLSKTAAADHIRPATLPA